MKSYDVGVPAGVTNAVAANVFLEPVIVFITVHYCGIISGMTV